MTFRVPPVQAVTAIRGVEAEGELRLGLQGALGTPLSGSALQEQLLGAPLLPAVCGVAPLLCWKVWGLSWKVQSFMVLSVALSDPFIMRKRLLR